MVLGLMCNYDSQAVVTVAILQCYHGNKVGINAKVGMNTWWKGLSLISHIHIYIKPKSSHFTWLIWTSFTLSLFMHTLQLAHCLALKPSIHTEMYWLVTKYEISQHIQMLCLLTVTDFHLVLNENTFIQWNGQYLR